jgi:hypothetical protein
LLLTLWNVPITPRLSNENTPSTVVPTRCDWFGMTKQKSKKGKRRGPKEQRLIVTEDPQTALARLLRAFPKKVE